MKRFLFVAASLLVCCAFLMTASTAMAGTRPQATATSGAAEAGPGHEVVLSDLPNITVAEMAGARQAPVARNPHFTDAEYRALKLAAPHSGAGTRPQDAPNAMAPSNQGANASALTPGLIANFYGQFQGCNGSGWTPSDMGLAVNSTYVVQAVNECITVYNKTGGIVVAAKDLCTFFGRAPNSGYAGCFDPRAIYDFQANKFIVIASYKDGNGEGWIDIAAASNPTLAWTVHHLDMGQALPDYPTIGQTAYKNNTLNSIITVCANMYLNAGGFYAQCNLLPKKKVYGTAGFSWPYWYNFTVGGLIMDTLQPANVYETEENPRAQYAVNAINYNGTDGFCTGGSSKGLVVWSFSDATGSQGSKLGGYYTGCNTSGYNVPGAADDGQYCTSCVETIDNRITATVHYASGRLYPSIDTYNGWSSAVLGWIVRPYLNDNGGGCTGGVNCATVSGATIETEYCYDCGGSYFAEAFFGAQVPTPENDWTMFATFSSYNSNISPGMFVTSNRVSWPTPFHDGGYFTCQNNANYTQGRWGDYAAAAPDIPGVGSVPATWGSGMFIQANGAWGTCISEIRPGNGI